jgi:polysaccharide deacetylase family protein (PEP-CTERM system associated)
MKNAFTIDLEDWFCSHNLKEVIQYEQWDHQVSRVERNTDILLDLLQKNRTKATFFVLGWVADRFPHLIKSIHQEGHEIASHGYAHRQLTCMSPTEFEEDIIQSIRSIAQIIGQSPLGYRAPAFSLTTQTAWAIPILKKLHFTYDSSIYPITWNPDYGVGDALLTIHQHANGLVEVPLSCATFGKQRVPCSGGAYLRFYPFFIFNFLVKQTIKQGRPFIFYIHPWEVDNGFPKVSMPFSKAIRHHYNLDTTIPKITRLLQEFEFTTMHDVLCSESFIHETANP